MLEAAGDVGPAGKAAASARGGALFSRVADAKADFPCDHLFFQKLLDQCLCHFMEKDAGVFGGVVRKEDLSGGNRAGFRRIGADIRQRAGLPAPGVVDERGGIFAKEAVERRLGDACDAV